MNVHFSKSLSPLLGHDSYSTGIRSLKKTLLDIDSVSPEESYNEIRVLLILRLLSPGYSLSLTAANCPPPRIKYALSAVLCSSAWGFTPPPGSPPLPVPLPMGRSQSKPTAPEAQETKGQAAQGIEGLSIHLLTRSCSVGFPILAGVGQGWRRFFALVYITYLPFISISNHYLITKRKKFTLIFG